VSTKPGAGQLAPEFEAAAAVIREAAGLARRAQDRLLDVAVKSGPADLVSQVDRDLDTLIVSRLLDRFPADGSLSEEGGHRPGTSGRTWVVDPVDGTHNYIAGLPYYGISIALMEGSRTLLGLVHDATDGTVHAASTASARDAGQGQEPAIPPSATTLGASPPHDANRGQLKVSSALVAVNLPAAAIFSGSGLRPPLDRIGDIRITGSLCLDLAWTALGRYDACAYRHRDNPWDWAAGELIARSRGRSVIFAQWAEDAIVVVGRPDVTAALAHA
jgi:myo-inositol-1(or 4)-monophosphatase